MSIRITFATAEASYSVIGLTNCVFEVFNWFGENLAKIGTNCVVFPLSHHALLIHNKSNTAMMTNELLREDLQHSQTLLYHRNQTSQCLNSLGKNRLPSLDFIIGLGEQQIPFLQITEDFNFVIAIHAVANINPFCSAFTNANHKFFF